MVKKRVKSDLIENLVLRVLLTNVEPMNMYQIRKLVEEEFNKIKKGVKISYPLILKVIRRLEEKGLVKFIGKGSRGGKFYDLTLHGFNEAVKHSLEKGTFENDANALVDKFLSLIDAKEKLLEKYKSEKFISGLVKCYIAYRFPSEFFTMTDKDSIVNELLSDAESIIRDAIKNNRGKFIFDIKFFKKSKTVILLEYCDDEETKELLRFYSEHYRKTRDSNADLFESYLGTINCKPWNIAKWIRFGCLNVHLEICFSENIFKDLIKSKEVKSYTQIKIIDTTPAFVICPLDEERCFRSPEERIECAKFEKLIESQKSGKVEVVF